MIIDTTIRELRHAARLLARAPAVTTLVLAILGLALAANVVLFSILDTALFRPLALPDADRLVNIYTVGARGAGYGGLSLPDYADLTTALTDPQQPALFTEVFGYSGLMAAASVDASRPEVIFGEMVTANYFVGSGARLALGAGFSAADDRIGEPPRVVLGHRFWQRRFAADPSAVGRTLRLNGLPFTVVGVAAPDFGGLLFTGLSADVWVPMSALTRFRGDVRADRGERWLFVKGRLRDGVDAAHVTPALDLFGAQLDAAHPDTNADRTFRAIRSADVIINPEADPAVRPLAAAVIAVGMLVLVIASANVASVLMARMAQRGRELAIRVSIGATRRQLTALLASEAVLLGGGALMVGMSVSYGALALLQSWRPALPVPLGWRFELDTRVLIFAAAATALTMAVVAVLPAWRASRIDPLAMLRGAAAARRGRLGRERLLIPQIALSLVLLVVAGLFVRSLQNAAAMDPGFVARNTALIAINPGLSGYDEARATQFWQTLLRDVREQDGIRAAALTDRIPLDLYGSLSAELLRDGGEPFSLQAAHVSDRYFDTLGIPLQQGRDFTVLDGSAEERAAIVSRSTAARLWPNHDALGSRVRVGQNGQWHTIVGIVGDVQLLESLGEEDSPMVYLPFRTGHAGLVRIVAASRGDDVSLERRLMAAAHNVDPDVAIFETRRLDEHLGTMLLPYRAAAAVAFGAGMFGLLLTMAGTAGSVAHVLSARARELGIRAALGASRWAILRATTGRAVRATLMGLAAGWLVSAATARALGGVLFGIAPLDPLTLTVVPLLLVTAVVVAVLPSLRQALTLDAAVLRHE